MTKKESGRHANSSIVNPETHAIKVPERGLIGAYMQRKRDAVIHQNIAHMLKDAIINRADIIVNDYASFIQEEYQDEKPVSHIHPSIDRRRSNKQKRRRIDTFPEHVLESVDGKKRKIKYQKIYGGEKLVGEKVTIVDLNSNTMNYIEIEFTAKRFSMRNSTSIQNLTHGDPHIVPMVEEASLEEHGDILDTLTDELELIKRIKIGALGVK